MKIKSIEELKRNINRSTIMIFVIIFSFAILGLYITHSKFIENRSLLNEQEIDSAGEIFKSNLSEKLSIIASSTVFLDYLRSGEVTRNRLYTQLLAQMSSLKDKSISGMDILDNKKSVIFNLGSKTPYFVTLKLCYLNQTLDSKMGDCQFNWKLYFDISELTIAIPSIDKSIKICSQCNHYNLIDDGYFGSFPILRNATIKLPFIISNEKDYFFYVYFLLMTAALILFGSWSWYRVSGLLNNYISLPIKNLISSLKTDKPFQVQENIDEIQFLISEINQWKFKLSKAQSAENTAKLANIAAQLAHDVRSPLSAIDMLVKNINNIPENSRVVLHNATQRISDIANNFLLQYKRPNEALLESSLSNEYIPSILESMVSEKRNQYLNRDINIILSIDNNAWDVFSYINPVDFKRALSNLINNSVEAINETGRINIKLIKLNKYLRIEIIDNGIGIPADILPKVVNGGISIGKKNGSGLGLSHAINKIESWHGDIDIKSEVEEGTIVGINLPLSNKMPEWFKFSLSFNVKPIICILDDESYTHNLWMHRFENIKPLFKSIEHFYKASDAEAFLAQTKINEIIFLVDFDLGTDQLSGLDFIQKFHIHNHSTLVTSRYDDIEIQKRCIDLGVKIIPKNLISYIPIYN